VVPIKILQLFTPDELQKVISGEKKDLDIVDLRANCVIHGFEDMHGQNYLHNFWIVLENFDKEDK